MDNYNEFDDLPLAERLKHELRLFRAIETEWKATSKLMETYPKGYRKFKIRKLMSDVKKGIAEIRKKNKLYVEMPKLVNVGNGQVKKVYDNISSEKQSDDEIEVQLSTCESNNLLIE